MIGRSAPKKRAKARLLFPFWAAIAKEIVIATGWRASSAIFSPRINSSVVLMTAQHGIIPRDFSVRVRLSRGTNLPVKLIALTRVERLTGKGRDWRREIGVANRIEWWIKRNAIFLLFNETIKCHYKSIHYISSKGKSEKNCRKREQKKPLKKSRNEKARLAEEFIHSREVCGY